MKQTSTYFFIGILVLLAALLGYVRYAKPFHNIAATKPESQQKAPQPTVVKNELTNQQKIARLLVVPMLLQPDTKPQNEANGASLANTSTTNSVGTHGVSYSAETVVWLHDVKPGAVLLVGKQSASVSAKLAISQIATASGNTNPVLVMASQTGDDRLLFADAKNLQPKMLGEVCNQATEAVAAGWSKVAESWHDLGINVVLGPVIDRPAAGSWMRRQGCTNDAKTYELARAYVSSFGKHEVMPVIAHFPGVGTATRNPKNGDQLLNIVLEDVQPFKGILDEFSNIGVLTTAVRVKDKFDNKPCLMSAECLEKFPKQHKDALLIADSISLALATAEKKTIADTIYDAIMAGNHLVIMDETLTLPEIKEITNQLAVKYSEDQSFQKKVDEAMAKIMSLYKPVGSSKTKSEAVVTPTSTRAPNATTSTTKTTIDPEVLRQQ